MDGKQLQVKQLARLNSSASVSDLSEALSDMSLSTSPGSGDITAQEIKNMSLSSARDGDCKGMDEEVSAPSAAPRKRLVVRQMSSNPYLASAEMSPSDDHPLIASSHSYAAGESRLYQSIEAYAGQERADLYYRSNSYPLTSDCVEETDEEDEDDEDDEEDESQIGDNVHTGLDYERPCNRSLRSTEMCEESNLSVLNSSRIAHPKYCASKTERNELNVSQTSPSRFTKSLTPGVSPTLHHISGVASEHENDNNLPDRHGAKQKDSSWDPSHQSSSGNNQHHHFCQQHYHGHPHHCRHYSLQPSHQSAHNHQSHQTNGKNHTKHEEPGHGPPRHNKNGYSNQTNSLHNKSLVQDGSTTSSYLDSQFRPNQQQSRTMEVSAWGHFYRQQENHYKYRRSHYSSDSEDETVPHPYSGGKAHHSKQARPQYHQHFKNPGHCRGRQHSPSHQNDNANKSSQIAQIPLDKAVRTHSGVKPIEFRNRFQVIFQFYLTNTCILIKNEIMSTSK